MKGLPKRGKKQDQPEAEFISYSVAKKKSEHDILLSFSFRYFKQSPSEFDITKKESQYFLKVLERLSVLSMYTVAELKQCDNKTLRCHSIEWKKTSQKNFGLPDEQIAKQPYQFSISANKHGRIMGFFTDNVFHIVWFDHSHSVYN